MAIKKIVIVGPCYPYRGGNALTMSYLYKALTDSGKFEVVFVNFSLLYPTLLFPGTTQYDESDEHFIKVPSVRLVNAINPISWWRTAQFIARTKPDLIAIDWWQPFFGPAVGTIARLLRKQYRGKILLMTENVISHEARFIDRFLTQIGLQPADKFLAFSQKVVDDLAPFRGKKPIFRSELPIFDWYKKADIADMGSEKIKLGFAPTDTVFLFFGYVRRYKGLDILIAAFAQLATQHPDWKLLVCGEFYDDPADYQQQVADLGIATQVKIINEYIPNEAVTRYFEVAELVVQPYRSATQSGILNIAYGCAKPVVVTNVGGLQEFVTDGETGIVVEAGSPEAVAEGIRRYFALKPTVDFADNIRRRVSQNAFGKIADTFESIMLEK